jgi:tripartite-type tricarboxylate transporter receptor subunit TctC
MAELASYSKQRRGEVRYGSPGPGSVLHLGVEWFQSVTGTEMIHIPYRGGGPMMQALVAGTVDLVLTSADFAKNFGETGKLKALAQADKKRHPLLPNVPTTADAGFPDLQVVSWFGILGPAKLPRPIADRLATEIQELLKDEELLKKMELVGTAPAYRGGESFTQFIGDEAKKWDRIVKDAKIPLQD